MPGKVNPVIPEAVNQVAFAVAGADVTVTMAAEAGQLQLNAFEPVIAHSLLQSIAWMTQACWTLRVNCVDGITANDERLEAMVASSVGVITALIPFIGYAEAAKLAKTALATGRPIADLVVEAGLMTREEVVKQLAGEALGPGARDAGDPGDRPQGGALRVGRSPGPAPAAPPTGRRAARQMTRQCVVSEPMPPIETVTVEPSRRNTCGLRE